ncbi:DUF5682 family protein [Acinetobacter sp. TR3]|uniref:DUF5682 family protein n=1 Tax=Acinetobacter sp. TR3 TaxID=3003392 RepID=UPI0022AC783A|nr:DUF5682 family protein [Acinetobacter sp. TR3]WAU77451.1 DUF5682 family protein [Acinetobacter sp. TR3]
MLHILGIRHHGPGSARSVCNALASIQPDCILIEGPPDANAIIAQLQHADFKPPVALLLNTPVQKEVRSQAVFYPFAEFSPEWQALQYALRQQVAVEFMDLPLQHRFALEKQWAEQRLQQASADEQALADEQEIESNQQDDVEPEQNLEQHYLSIRRDPIQLLAEQAGYQDSERFWEHLVEQQPHAGQMFAAITDAMAALRDYLLSQQPENYSSEDQLLEQYREAYMRKVIKQAEKQGYQNIVVICGAWHAPVLADLKAQNKADTALLKGLPKVKVDAAWIAWTHGRLSRDSGYGAGVQAVGWYTHLWKHYQQALDENVDGEKISIDWLSKFAQALRQAGHDASSAQIIDAVQLIQSLLQLRGRRIPDLEDLFEVIRSVLNHGLYIPQPILAKLLEDEQLGQVPDELIELPIQKDFLQQVKHFRLKLEAPHRDISLDLREAFDLAKSQFLHCVKLLGLAWADLAGTGSKQGNFKEAWQLSWQPESSLYLNEMSLWGNSIQLATQSYLENQIRQCEDVAQIAQLIESILLSGLDQSLNLALDKLNELTTQHQDPSIILATLKPLITAIRYGSVRQFSMQHLHQVVEHLAIRLMLSLPSYCVQLNAEMAQQFAQQLQNLYELLEQLQQDELLQLWQETLEQLLQLEQMQGYLHGCCVRSAREQQLIDVEQTQEFLSRALSIGQTADYSAAWFEGFLTHQALLLIHEQSLWDAVSQWVNQLQEQQFIELLPILARTASSFSPAEAQQLIQKVTQKSTAVKQEVGALDIARAQTVLDEIYAYLQPVAVEV